MRFQYIRGIFNVHLVDGPASAQLGTRVLPIHDTMKLVLDDDQDPSVLYADHILKNEQSFVREGIGQHITIDGRVRNATISPSQIAFIWYSEVDRSEEFEDSRK